MKGVPENIWKRAGTMPIRYSLAHLAASDSGRCNLTPNSQHVLGTLRNQATEARANTQTAIESGKVVSMNIHEFLLLERLKPTASVILNDSSLTNLLTFYAMAAVSREDTARLAKQDKGPETVAIISSFMALAIICVGLRTFTRLKITKMFGIEDAFIVLPVVMQVHL